MKKLLCVIFSLALSSSLVLPVVATNSDHSPSLKEMYRIASSQPQIVTASADTTSIQASATLENDLGDVYDVAVYEYLPARQVLSNGLQTKTFVCSTENISPRSYGLEESKKGYDDSYSVYGRITITYNSRPNGSYTEYLLTRVEGEWEKEDSRVVMSDRFVAYCCQYVFNIDQITWKYPTSNTFDYSTGYMTYVPNDRTTAVLGGASSVTLSHGSSSEWDLHMSANVFTNDIGIFVFS